MDERELDLEKENFIKTEVEIKEEEIDSCEKNCEEERLCRKNTIDECETHQIKDEPVEDVFIKEGILDFAEDETDIKKQKVELKNSGDKPSLSQKESNKLQKARYMYNKSLSVDEALLLVLCPDGEDSENDGEEEEINELASPFQQRSDGHDDDEMENIIEKLVASAQLEIENRSANAEDEVDDVSLSSLFPSKNRSQMRDAPGWHKTEFVPPSDITWKDTLIIDESWYDKTPLSFFNLIFDNELIQHICKQTNMYALQSQGKELGLLEAELKTFFGILMKFGILNPPSYRYFWKTSSRYDVIADSMSRDRFEQIKRFLHFSDNTLLKPKYDPNFDKLFKVRPVIDSIKNNCSRIPQEQHQAIDEQIIPTKACVTMKQYNPKKPHKWGYKVISRAGASGFIYDFEVYTGKGTVKDPNDVGLSSAFVLRLTEGVPKHKNYRIFYDDWFSSLPLADKLKEDGILFLSTVRPNRLKGCLLKEENKLKKEGRGSFDYCVEQNTNIIAIKWYDNKPVHLLSTYAGIEPLDTCSHWDRKVKKRIKIQRPFAVKEYNKYRGGVDLSDMMIKLYRTNFKSTKWYMRIFFYLLDLSVVNAWLLYCRVNSQVQNGKMISLCDFKEDISSGLMAPAVPKRGRPCSAITTPLTKKRKTRHPADSTRFDNISHLPDFVKDRQRCRECIKALTRVKCIKCNVSLCLTNQRNCFIKYHSK